MSGSAFLPILWVRMLSSFSLFGGAAWYPPSVVGAAFPLPFWVVLLAVWGPLFFGCGAASLSSYSWVLVSTTQRRGRKEARPKGGRGQAAPPKGWEDGRTQRRSKGRGELNQNFR